MSRSFISEISEIKLFSRYQYFGYKLEELSEDRLEPFLTIRLSISRVDSP
nr:MAG TPA: hypothetical protein [Bacteriophage sp.]